MKVKEIQIDGFGVWTGLSVDSLQDGMTLFYGPNEAGKTTLMQFVRAILYGFDDDRRECYFPPAFGGRPGGSLQITELGNAYAIERHRDSNGDHRTGHLSVVGKDGGRQGHHRLTTLLGEIDEAIFTNVFAFGLRELQELSALDDTEAADELYKLSSGLDRVSLVDVMRGLREHRSSLVGQITDHDSERAQKLSLLVEKRERLRSEVKERIRNGRRWEEIAARRITQQQEISDLIKRIAGLEHKARCVEVAVSVYETWMQQHDLKIQIDDLASSPLLPEDAPTQLSEIEASLENGFVELECVKEQRREIRRKAAALPINRRFAVKRGAVEAALQQLPWIEVLQEQLTALDEQIDKARSQLELDSERLGFGESDLRSEYATRNLPELSREAIASLAQPAQNVKQQVFRLRQAKAAKIEHQKLAGHLAEKLTAVLERAGETDLPKAIREHTDELRRLRNRIQLDHHLNKLKRHYRDLERETVELTTAEALPLDRLMLLAVPFVFGAIAVMHGAAHLLGLTFLTEAPDATWGLACVMMGVIGLALFYFGRENGTRRNSQEREACERQIDSLRQEIRGLESEKQKLNLRIAVDDQSLESSAQEKEMVLSQLEATLPTYHRHEAEKQLCRIASEQSVKANKELEKAREDWADALELLGLSRSLSPSKVKNLSADYERLQLSLRRLQGLEDERQQRQHEKSTVAKHVDALYCAVLPPASTIALDAEGGDAGEFDNSELDDTLSEVEELGPLTQLRRLQRERSQQLRLMKRREEFKAEDVKFKRQQLHCRREIEMIEQRRSALWSRCGVENAEQFAERVDRGAELTAAKKEYQELQKTLLKMIGPHLDAEQISSEINNSSAADLELRWEQLTAKISDSEERLSTLQTQQGEMSQELKHLGEDSRLATAKLELGCVERKLESMIRQWQALATTSFLLQDVCATFERERQPETLREASLFLTQLTNGKYLRVWTSLGTNQLNVDDLDGNTLQIDRLSRGTREAVFIALRLSLVATYARRGVLLPLVLDDVLVNFDRQRATYAANTLKDFACRGHQVLMFTCHQHIVEMFQEIGVEIRVMPPHGTPGNAIVLHPQEQGEKVVRDDQDGGADLIPEAEVSQSLVANAQDYPDDDPPASLQNPRVGGDDALKKEAATPSKSVDPLYREEKTILDSPPNGTVSDSVDISSDRRDEQSLEASSWADSPQDLSSGEDVSDVAPKQIGIDWAWFEKDTTEITEEIIRADESSSDTAEMNEPGFGGDAGVLEGSEIDQAVAVDFIEIGDRRSRKEDGSFELDEQASPNFVTECEDEDHGDEGNDFLERHDDDESYEDLSFKKASADHLEGTDGKVGIESDVLDHDAEQESEMSCGEEEDYEQEESLEYEDDWEESEEEELEEEESLEYEDDWEESEEEVDLEEDDSEQQDVA